jgi:hypothetical protein
MLRVMALFCFAIAPGLAGVAVSGYYVLQDWASLNRAFARWGHIVRFGGSERALMIADSYQNAFRINCFADGVGVLLSAILCGIGVLGLCLLSHKHKAAL